MSNTVDNRVVSMTFENASFEKKLSETITSLDKLRQSLDFSKTQDSMKTVGEALNRFSMTGMTNQIENVSKGFLAMSGIALSVISNLTNRVVDAGISMAKALSMDGILSGFQEYELKMGSIQTILSNTQKDGTTLEEVTANLDELNTYADKTIYSFGQMTKNIGLFTNAGIGVADATAMIKGFANEAAASGTNAEGMASAAYQLSQALSSGTIRLMDWRSLTNVGMGNANMKAGIIEIAQAMGTLEANGTSATEVQKDFNASLEKNWLSADVMSNYLKIMAGEMTAAEQAALGLSKTSIDGFAKQQKISEEAATKVRTLTQLMGTMKESVGSSWSETFTLLFGDFNEATTLFTDVHGRLDKTVSKMSDARNALITGWKAFGGRTLLLDSLAEAIRGIGTILTPIREAFREIFPPTTVARLLILTKQFSEFTKTIAISAETAAKIKSAFRGVFATFEIGWNIVKGIASVFKNLVGALLPVGGGALNAAASWGDFMSKLNETWVAGGQIRAFFDMLIEKLQIPIAYIKNLRDQFTGLFEGVNLGDGVTAISGVMDAIGEKFEGFKNLLASVGGSFGWIGERVRSLATTLGEVWDEIAGWFEGLGDRIADFLKPKDFDAAVDAINVGLLGGILFALRKFTKDGLSVDLTGGFMNQLTDTLAELTNVLQAMTQQIKADTIQKIAVALAILAASILLIAFIPSDKLTKAMTTLGIGLGSFITSLKALSLVAAGPRAASSIAILSTALVALSGAILILALAVQVLARLSPEQLATGLAGVAGMLTALSVASVPLSKNSKGMIAAGTGISIMATGLITLAFAVKMMGELSWEELAKGMYGLGVGLGIMIVALKAMPATLGTSAVQLVLLAGSIGILAAAIFIIARLDWEGLTKGLAGIAGGLLIMVGALHLMPENLGTSALQIVLLSGAMLIMAGAMKIFASMSIEEIGKSLIVLAGTLFILTAAMAAMTSGLAGAATLVIVTAALYGLAGLLKILGNLSTTEIAVGLGVLAGTLALLAVASAVLVPFIPGLLAMGAALIVIGAGFALLGVGVYLIAEGFAKLGQSMAKGTKGLVKALEILIAAIPDIAAALVKSLGGLIVEILKLVPKIVELLGKLLGELLDIIIKYAPKVAEALVALVLAALDALRAILPELITFGLEMIKALFGGIADNIGDITKAAVDIVVNFAKALTDNIDRLVTAGADLIIAFLNAIGAQAGRIAEAGAQVLVDFLAGIANNIFRVGEAVTIIITTFLAKVAENTLTIVDAGTKMITDLITGIGDKVGDMITAGKDAALKFLDGLIDDTIDFTDKAGQLIVKFLNGMAEAIRKNSKAIGDAAENLADAIIDGIIEVVKGAGGRVLRAFTGMLGGVVDGVKGFLQIDSPSKVFMDIGENIIAGFVKAIETDDSAERASRRVAENSVNTFKYAIEQIPKELGSMDEFNPTITPVLDLTNVQKGAKTISAYLGTTPITASVSMDRANVISRDTVKASEEAEAPVPTEPRVIEQHFVQNNHSPKALTTADIYKNTRSQIALSKKALEEVK